MYILIRVYGVYAIGSCQFECYVLAILSSARWYDTWLGVLCAGWQG